MTFRSALARPPLAALLFALAAIGLAPPAPRAEIVPEARAVVERYVEATGGRAAWEAQRSQRVVATIEAFGLKGTARTWTAGPDHRASEVSLGPFRLLDGFDGVTAWRTDPSGKVLKLDGKDLEDAVAGAWFESERWCAADQGGGKVAPAGTEKDSTGEYTVLEVTPPAGKPRRLWFERATGLLARTVQKNDQQTMVSRASDWRTVAGRKAPFRLVQEVQGMTMNTLTLTVDTLETNVEIPASRFALPGGEANAPAFLKTPGLAKLPAEYRAKHLWLRVSINGQPPADFLYDTGASITVLDSAYAAKLGIARQGQMQGAGAGASGSASFGEIQSLRIAAPDGDGIEMKGLKVGILDVNSGLAPFFWRDCAGVVGFDFINRFVNEIDYDRGVITLRDPKTFRYEGGGATLPFTLAGHIPAVKFTLDGQYSGECRLDVGSSGSMDLHGPFWKKNDLAAKTGKKIEIVGGGFGGTFTSALTRMKTLELGPFRWEAPLVTLTGAEGGAFMSEDYAANAGNGVLERFKVTIDYEKREIHLEKGAKFGAPFGFSRFGAQLMLKDGVVQVGQVLKGSPAARAGLAVGDEVVSVNGKSPREWDLDGVNRLFDDSPAGAKLAIEFVHDGKKTKKSVKLEEII